jgi:hypothetical protein
MPPNPSLRPLLTRLRTAIRRHNEAATSLSTLQAENMLLNPKARHMPPSSPMELPTMSALKAENRAAVKLRREVRGILKTTGIMAQEIARLGRRIGLLG